jgi:hypothetical protein
MLPVVAIDHLPAANSIGSCRLPGILKRMSTIKGALDAALGKIERDDKLSDLAIRGSLLQPFVPPILPEIGRIHRDRADLASDFFERLNSWILEYQEGLDSETEIGLGLVSFGLIRTIHLSEMSYWNPALIRFDGLDENGKPTQLIQHVSQISVLLTSVPKQGDHPKRIVGFNRESGANG